MKRTRSLLLFPVILALSACAGKLDLQPGAEAYVDAGGRRAMAVGVQGPRLLVDSDGMFVGTGSPDVVAAGSEVSGSLKALGTVVSLVGGLFVMSLLAVGGVYLLKKKKE